MPPQLRLSGAVRVSAPDPRSSVPVIAQTVPVGHIAPGHRASAGCRSRRSAFARREQAVSSCRSRCPPYPDPSLLERPGIACTLSCCRAVRARTMGQKPAKRMKPIRASLACCVVPQWNLSPAYNGKPRGQRRIGLIRKAKFGKVPILGWGSASKGTAGLGILSAIRYSCARGRWPRSRPALARGDECTGRPVRESFGTAAHRGGRASPGPWRTDRDHGALSGRCARPSGPPR